MKPIIRRILREETDPTFGDKVWDAVKEVGKLALKHNGLSWLIRKVVGTTPTKARLIFPKKGWETIAIKILEQIGVVTGTYETLEEADNFFKDLKKNGIILEELLIGSHGSAGRLLVTQKGGRKIYKEHWVDSDELFKSSRGKDGQKGYWVTTKEVLYESGMRYAFKTSFLKHIKPVVNSNTKVYFTACSGAEKLTMLKEAADYLGCECYACMGKNIFSFGCEDSNWSCNATPEFTFGYSVPSFNYSSNVSEKEKEIFIGKKLSGWEASEAYTKKVNDFYVKHGVCQEQPNIPFNWVTLFG
mgnify:CR=1 FL=1|tara:strand:- start:2308 stop:3210 length:903 start_codon:yes stop_codon:yes gene_type:complete